MKTKKVESLQENEILALPVCTEEGEVLLPKGTELKREYMDILISLNIAEIQIEDKYSSYEQPTWLITETEKETYLNRIQKLLENHIYKERASLRSVKDLAFDLVEYTNKMDLDKVYDMLYQKTNLYEHTLRVTILSLLTARKLKLSKGQLYAITVGALLHDLGLRYITVSYIDRDLTLLSPEEMFEYKKHTILAYTVLDGKEDWLPEISKEMILSHHEKSDGSGFPLKQKNQKMECKILQLCDTFDCLISGMECRRYPIDQVIEYFLVESENKYDKKAMTALFSMIAKYPVGTEVELTNGKYGIVKKQTKHPEFPVIMELTEADGKIMGEKVFDLECEQNNGIYRIL